MLTVLELIELRSFSNIWYWLVLAAIWSAAARRPLGVPYDMVERARRRGGEAERELGTLARLMASRALRLAREGGPWTVAVCSAAASALIVLGFAYGIELAQAVSLLVLPLCAVAILSLRTAGRIVTGGVAADLLARHRRLTQALGAVTIFATAMWGMYVNIMAWSF